jgi:SAM-dependent methyltransferase
MIADQSIRQGTSTTIADLAFTGERIVPGKTPEPMFREHEARYVFAGRYVLGKSVVDVASGAGIGTSYLSNIGAVSCIGLDIDPEAIEYAKAAYHKCEFLQSDATETGLPDSSVDVIVSFETIEHITDQKKFLVECKRILKPNGQLICSTPNRTICHWHRNPYHVRELTPQEFAHLIRTHFEDIHLFSQVEQFYPLYVLRVLASRCLDRLNLKGCIRGILGRKTATVAVRNEFLGEIQGPDGAIRPYRHSIFVKPMYLIAVARNSR